MSALDILKYEWIWEKPMATGRLNCNYAPMKSHENILVFSKSAACYVKNPDDAMIFHPQMDYGQPYTAVSGRPSSNYDLKFCKQSVTVNNGTRYPRDIRRFTHDTEQYHPTQKPVALLEYLIRTYTNSGDVVLDNCMGSGSTAIACINTDRRFIGMELNEEYFNIAKTRIVEHMKPMKLV